MSSKTYRSIIVSHQARLRCFLHDYLINNNDQSNSRSNSSDSYDSGVTDVESVSSSGSESKGGGGGLHRFQNGCVIKLIITSTSLSLELVYNGSIDEEKPTYTYYVKPGTIDEKAKQGKYQIEELHPIFIKVNFEHINPSNTFEFYLIRHGQAEHNVLKGMSKAFSNKNTKLTEDGRAQALSSGKHLKDIVRGKEIDYLFASDLNRTSETMGHFLKGFNNQLMSKSIVILPCSHELTYTKNSHCDGHQGITPNENISTCEPGKTGKTLLTRQTIDSCDTIGDLRLDWSFYSKFYGSGTRRKRGSEVSKQCRDTDMFKEAIEYITSKEGRAKLSSLLPDMPQTTRDKMSNNLNKLNDLSDKSDQLKEGANAFAKSAQQLALAQKSSKLWAKGGKTRRKRRPGSKRKGQSVKRKRKGSIGVSRKQHCKYGRRKYHRKTKKRQRGRKSRRKG